MLGRWLQERKGTVGCQSVMRTPSRSSFLSSPFLANSGSCAVFLSAKPLLFGTDLSNWVHPPSNIGLQFMK